jgi:hypothetical protein
LNAPIASIAGTGRCIVHPARCMLPRRARCMLRQPPRPRDGAAGARLPIARPKATARHRVMVVATPGVRSTDGGHPPWETSFAPHCSK